MTEYETPLIRFVGATEPVTVMVDQFQGGVDIARRLDKIIDKLLGKVIEYDYTFFAPFAVELWHQEPYHRLEWLLYASILDVKIERRDVYFSPIELAGFNEIVASRFIL